ncbi:MAG TPA: flavin reductase family protein [Candidatus Thermoplasmatota archaeon]|nr:flavin reductase family protein [Candidatus Thermoplasmatota archaeon]
MDAAAKKLLLRKIPFGLYVCGARQGDRVHAFLLSWFTQASFDPPLVALGVKRDGRAHDMLLSDRAFVVNFLGSDQKQLAVDFLKTAVASGGTISGHPWTPGKNGAPVLDEVPGYLEGRILHHFEHGDHTVMIGEVTEAAVRRGFDLLTGEQTGWKYGG